MQTAEPSAFCSYNTTIADFKRSFAAPAYVTYSTWEKLCHTSKREENTRWIYYSIQDTLRHIHHVAKWHTTSACHIVNYIKHNRSFTPIFYSVVIVCFICCFDSCLLFGIDGFGKTRVCCVCVCYMHRRAYDTHPRTYARAHDAQHSLKFEQSECKKCLSYTVTPKQSECTLLNMQTP